MEKSDRTDVMAERIAPMKKYHLQVRYSLSLFSIPRDYSEKRQLGVRMDWPGACLSVPAAVFTRKPLSREE
jgi:hypothetical protein